MSSVDFDMAIGVGSGPGGMSLLDWFAGQALLRPGVNAADAYELAVAMLKSRKEAKDRIRNEGK